MPKSFELPKTSLINNEIYIPYNCRQTVKVVAGVEQVFWKYDLIKQPIPLDFNYRDIAQLKQVTLNRLNSDLQQYIYNYYDAGTQATINGYATRALYEDRLDIIVECRKVQDWIDTVLDYYDSKKDLITASATDQERMCVTWDFRKDVPMNNYIDWRFIKALFSA